MVRLALPARVIRLLGDPHDPLVRVTPAEMRAALRAAPPGAHLRATLSAVLLHIGRNGEPCSAGILALSEVAGCDEKQYRRNLQQLLDAGVLVRELRAGKPSLLSTPADDRTPAYGVPPPTGSPADGVPPSEAASTPVGGSRRVRREEPPTGGSGAENGSLFSEPEKPRPPARARPAPPNADLFAALVSAAGWKLDQMTASQRQRTGKAAKELAAVGATPDTIAGQALAMETAWGNAPAPWTVASHWGSPLGRKPRRAATWTPREETA